MKLAVTSARDPDLARRAYASLRGTFWERRLADRVAGMDAAALWDRIVA